jgi:HlyD family secretion protein
MTARKPLFAAALLLLAAGAVAAWWIWRDRQGDADAVVLHGNVDIRQVELAFNASGRIAHIDVQEGDRVKPDQLLAEIDTAQLRHAAAEADARVAAQRQTVAALEAGSRPEEIRKATADVAARQADVTDAEHNYERIKALVAQRFVSQQQADNARFALEAAQAQLKSAAETRQLVVAGPRAEDKAAARATLAALEAAAALARRNLEDGSLRAPSAGVIENRILEPGDMASPQKPVLTMALTDPLWVRAYVGEPDLGKVRVGSLAWVSTDSYPDKRYAAWVGYISPTAEFTPKSVETQEVRTSLVYQARVFVCDAAGELRQGMPATVHIPLDQPREPPADPCKDRSGAPQ